MSETEHQVPCPACKKTITVPANWVGKRRPCPLCKEWVTMPAGATAAPAAPVAAAPAAPAAPTPATPAPASATSAKPLSFAERMKQAAERGTTQIRQKEEERARREASRGQAPDFEERMRTAKMGAMGQTAADAAAATIGPQDDTMESPGPDGTIGATREWGQAPVGEDDQRRMEREQKLMEASYAPEKIGRLSVVLCGISLLILVISLVVLCAGVGTASLMATKSAHGGNQPGVAGGVLMSFGVCMFGFSPVCSSCGFLLGLHSVLRSRHDKLWGALGTGLNGILVIPPIVLVLVSLLTH